jgi:hypothetical protein
MTAKRVASLRSDRADGWSYRDLGIWYGISHTQARRICLHESWKVAR